MVSFEERKNEYRLILFTEILNLGEAGVLDRRLVCLIHNTKKKVSRSPEYHSVFVFLLSIISASPPGGPRPPTLELLFAFSPKSPLRVVQGLWHTLPQP